MKIVDAIDIIRESLKTNTYTINRSHDGRVTSDMLHVSIDHVVYEIISYLESNVINFRVITDENDTLVHVDGDDIKTNIHNLFDEITNLSKLKYLNN